MTEFDANRLLLMIIYNFAGFLPRDVQGAALVKGIWLAEFAKYDVKPAEEAVKTIINTLHYPPQIADFRDLMGAGSELTRDDLQARLPGPVFGTEEGYKAMYTCDMSRVDKLMADLDNEIRTGKFKKTREEAVEANEVRECPSF